MEIPHGCRICKKESPSPEFVRVPGATRDVMADTFTVWRCRDCSTLNALEKVDYAKIYKNYPIQRQSYDFFAKRLFSKRLKILIRLGLKPHHTILDYGCGSGHFVRYLREKTTIATVLILTMLAIATLSLKNSLRCRYLPGRD